MIGPGLALAALVAAAVIAIALVRRPRAAAGVAVAGVLAAAALALPTMLDVLCGGGDRGGTIAWVEPVGQRRAAAADTWGCGYAAPTARMQSTARAFAALAGRMLPGPARPRIARTGPAGVFPAAGTLTADTDDPFTRSIYQPFVDRWARRLARLRGLQRGLLQLYILYVLIAVVAGLGFVAAEGRWGLP